LEEFKLAEITEVRIYKVRGNGVVKAYASVSLDGEYVVKGIKIIENEKGLFVSMPSKRNKDGTYQDIFYPTNRKARDKIVNAILQAYREL